MLTALEVLKRGSLGGRIRWRRQWFVVCGV
jgi:hypothetical protein